MPVEGMKVFLEVYAPLQSVNVTHLGMENIVMFSFMSLYWVQLATLFYKKLSNNYVIDLLLVQGTPPLSWVLIEGPPHLQLDQYTGRVNWARAEAGNHSVSVRVENQVGYAEVTWTLYASTTRIQCYKY